MTTNAERQQAWRDRRKAAGMSTDPRTPQEKRAQHQRERPWLFIDTEGATDIDGRYGDPGKQYVFTITAATDTGWQTSMYKRRPLTTAELLRFIYYLPSGHRLGGYFFGYDRDQILWQAPENVLRALYGSKMDPRAMMVGEFAVEIFATKLTIAKPENGSLVHEGTEYDRIPRGMRHREIWDVGRFYNAPFARVVENWEVATDADKRELRKMKAERNDFTIDYWERHAQRIIDYSILENRLACRLQTRFDATCSSLGYPLTQWYGAGSLAKAMLTAQGVQTQVENRIPVRRARTVQHDMAPAICAAYYGGRFEIQHPGPVTNVHEYDIRSAYPASYRFLPCMVHGKWTYTLSTDEPGRHDLCNVVYDIGKHEPFGPFPRRTPQKKIFYPYTGAGWVWGEELNAARQIWTDRIDVQYRFRYETDCDCRPFDWIDRVYRRRVELGKSTRGYPLKVGMNAAYGTLASALGAQYNADGSRESGWLMPEWAGLITAWTRARLLDALSHARTRADVLMFATDAIYSRSPLKLDTTDVLGGWEHEHYRGRGLIVQPGIYHLGGDTVMRSKMRGRGIDNRDIIDHLEDFYDAWNERGAAGVVSIPIRPRYVGMRSALHRNALLSAGHWIEGVRELAYTPVAKRMPQCDGTWGAYPAAGYGEPHAPFVDVLLEQEPAGPLELAQGSDTESQPDGPYL